MGGTVRQWRSVGNLDFSAARKSNSEDCMKHAIQQRVGLRSYDLSFRMSVYSCRQRLGCTCLTATERPLFLGAATDVWTGRM